eukprot:SAG25_NODE_1219_length_3579_cov_4.935632_4_plen_87_part_00
MEPCAPPAPRINFSLVAHGSENKLEMVLFGGERNDGKQVLFYRELYRYSMWNNKWSHVSPGGGAAAGAALRSRGLHVEESDVRLRG